MSHYNQRYAFVSSARLDAASGIGASPVVLGLMSALADKGKKVALVAPPSTLRLPPALRFAWFNLRAVRVLSSLDLDVVIGFDGDGHRFARSGRKAPFVAFHTGGAAEFVTRGGRRPRTFLAAARRADLVVVPSLHAGELLAESARLAPGRVAVLSPAIQPDQWRARTLPEHERPRVFAVAAGAQQAEFAWLVEGCVRARRSIGSIELQVSGAAQPQRWRRLALQRGLPPDAVTVDDRSRRSELKAELGACDLFVQLAGHPGGQPHLLWAMALGRPVIVADTPEARELSGDAAAVVPAQNSDALAATLVEILGSRSVAQAWARRGSEHATQATWAEAARRFGERLAEL